MANQNPFSSRTQIIINHAADLALSSRSEFLTPEHLLLSLCQEKTFSDILSERSSDLMGAVNELLQYAKTQLSYSKKKNYDLEFSQQMQFVIMYAQNSASANPRSPLIEVPHLIHGVLRLDDSFARDWLLSVMDEEEGEVLASVIQAYGVLPSHSEGAPSPAQKEEIPFCTLLEAGEDFRIVGREDEMDRAVMIMCRLGKNNPLLVGDPGVGKSTIVTALAQRISRGDVPERLRGRKIYSLDITSVLAGAGYRGEMEDRLKKAMAQIRSRGDVIVFVDNIHDLVGAGKSSDSTIDATSILLPYLEDSDIPFVGTTTFDSFKKTISRNRNLQRMFQRIDIEEPSQDEAVSILLGIKERFEKFHGVTISDDNIRYCVEASVKFNPEKRLPEKAIDLMDEGGAYIELHPSYGKEVNRELVNKILSDVVGVSVSDGLEGGTVDLRSRLLSRVFGQDSAVDAVCEAIYTSKAGLSDPRKPLASFLFVGPTGVGKTLLARELASAMGVALHRFDMSEYAEKHTVSKFIGAPAGYIGYDEGGLLTDAIRKTPRCVLLLDEIEKAHQDIYNLLLQVMDYGTMSDSKGQKADFRSAVIIMTSNAGARLVSRGGVGFKFTSNAGEVMSKEVKNVFAPEFLNRLSATVLFNDLGRDMAALIVDRGLEDLSAMLEGRKVSVTYTDAVRAQVLDEGFSPEYGARQIERTISKNIKPLLVHEILFGALCEGGTAVIDYRDGKYTVEVLPPSRS